ncbi:hypothetical protein TEA_000577 [Camellia sinensis var. sinensis]|uniref:Uncharacterized protein n=1 Tax=Camellia sinensis var. sinensis TaxID=542762 RepID=A0A4S4DLN5_CAMSN|nr:hypothetical protein TEA_000577 [Camellia sinensis var. sinensis]
MTPKSSMFPHFSLQIEYYWKKSSMVLPTSDAFPQTNPKNQMSKEYRMLSRPYAFNCILRLRASSEFKTGHSYGHFFPDPQYENVQHIICCDSYATYAYDFDFVSDVGFSSCEAFSHRGETEQSCHTLPCSNLSWLIFGLD